MKLYTVTVGSSPSDSVTFQTDDEEDLKIVAPYVCISLNFVVTREAVRKALEEQD